MRDLINIVESVGLANRRPGDRWQNPQGDELTFVDLVFYPRVAAFKSPGDMTAAVQAAAVANGISPADIVWTNSPGSNLAFALAHFVDANSQDYYVGRYFRQISPNATENRFPNDLPGGYRLQTAAAKKEQSGYKPSEILGSRVDNLTPDDIYAAVVAKFGQSSDEARAMAAFMLSDGTVSIPQGSMNVTAFTNYFCEILQPMSLVLGKKTTGNAADAETRYLTKGGYSTCLISFSSKKNEGLFDSRVTNPAGQSIGISTKVKSGADAAVKNLSDKIREMEGTADGRKLLKQYSQEVGLLKIIEEGGFVNAPLNLGVLFKIITPDQADEILRLRGKTAQQVHMGAANQRLYAERLKKIKDLPRVVPFFHMLAAVAFQVADHINENTNFGQAAATILNHGAFMTGRTYARDAGSNIELQPFEFEYPCEAVTDVVIKANKTYYSTGNNGNFTFQILKNGAQPADVEMTSAAVDTKPDVDLDAIDRAPRLTGPGARAARSQAQPNLTPAVLGRERRRN